MWVILAKNRNIFNFGKDETFKKKKRFIGFLSLLKGIINKIGGRKWCAVVTGRLVAQYDWIWDIRIYLMQHNKLGTTVFISDHTKNLNMSKISRFWNRQSIFSSILCTSEKFSKDKIRFYWVSNYFCFQKRIVLQFHLFQDWLKVPQWDHQKLHIPSFESFGSRLEDSNNDYEHGTTCATLNKMQHIMGHNQLCCFYQIPLPGRA